MLTRRQLQNLLAMLGRRALKHHWLVGLLPYLLLCALAYRSSFPFLRQYMNAQFGVDIAPHMTVIACLILFQGSVGLPAVLGSIQLVEDVEEGVDRAVALTPIPRWAPTAVVYGSVVLVTFVVLLIQWALVGISTPSLWPTVAGAGLLSGASACTCMLATELSPDRTSVLPSLKVLALFVALPIVGYVVPEAYASWCGLLPSYWGFSLWWQAAAGDPHWAEAIVPGVVVTFAWVGLLLGLRRRRARGPEEATGSSR